MTACHAPGENPLHFRVAHHQGLQKGSQDVAQELQSDWSPRHSAHSPAGMVARQSLSLKASHPNTEATPGFWI